MQVEQRNLTTWKARCPSQSRSAISGRDQRAKSVMNARSEVRSEVSPSAGADAVEHLHISYSREEVKRTEYPQIIRRKGKTILSIVPFLTHFHLKHFTTTILVQGLWKHSSLHSTHRLIEGDYLYSFQEKVIN